MEGTGTDVIGCEVFGARRFHAVFHEERRDEAGNDAEHGKKADAAEAILGRGNVVKADVDEIVVVARIGDGGRIGDDRGGNVKKRIEGLIVVAA
jgi:hypothetical protein